MNGARPSARPGDTTVARVERGPVIRDGWRELQLASGEVRPEPVPDGEVLACIWHLSDVHLCDAESPARAEHLDRFGDPDSPYREDLGDVGTYRPQETLTAHVAVAMVAAVNARLTGPTTGAPIDTALFTGDLTDNAQRNELGWYQRILEGGVISPRSGDAKRSSWVGATDVQGWDERYWHPDGPPPGVEPDLPSRRYGYPTIAGLVDASRCDVISPGLALPWLSVFGNHDGLLQGTVVPDDRLRELAIGAERITGLPAGVHPLSLAPAIAGVGPASYIHDHTSPRVPVPADDARDLLAPGEFAARTRGGDVEDDLNYFATDIGRLRVICLDTVNPHGGWQGSLGATQFAWLQDQLDAAAERYVLIASHHPSATLTNDHRPAGAEERVLGSELVVTLLEHPTVIGWIAGHVHFHAAGRHGNDARGFWELTTASLIDWPQQGRILEFVRVADRGRPEIAIVSTVVDHAAPVDWSPDRLDDPMNLAAISRVLSANDYRLRGDSLRGRMLDASPEVRNVMWRTADPLA